MDDLQARRRIGPKRWAVGLLIVGSLGLAQTAMAQEEKFDGPAPSFGADRSMGSGASSSGSGSGFDYVRRGVQLVEQGHYVAAIVEFDRAIERNPKDWNAYYYRCYARASLGQIDLAIADLTSIITAQKKAASAYSARGELFVLKGDWRTALSDYEKCLQLKPLNATACVGRANCLAALGRTEEAALVCQQLLARKPDHTQAHLCQMKVSILRKDFTAALADADEVLRRRPDNAEARMYRAMLRRKTGDEMGAIADYDFMIERAPDQKEIRKQRFETEVNAERLDLALRDLDWMLARKAGSGNLLLTRVFLLEGLKRHEEACESLDQVLDIAPSSLFLHGLRAYIEAEQGDYKGMIADVMWTAVLSYVDRGQLSPVIRYRHPKGKNPSINVFLRENRSLNIGAGLLIFCTSRSGSHTLLDRDLRRAFHHPEEVFAR